MKRHIVALLIVAMALPFIQGESGGCGGAIRMGGDEVDLEAQVPAGAEAGEIPISETAPIEEGQGPADVMIPEKVPEPERASDCSRYMPADPALAIALDAKRLDNILMDPVIFSNVEGMLREALHMNVDVKSLIEKLDSVCFACIVKQPETSSFASESRQTAVSSTGWSLDQCAEIIAVDVFKEEFPLQNAGLGNLVMDENGFYKVTDRFVMYQVAPNVIAFGTQAQVAKAAGLGSAPAESRFTKQIAIFSPASFAISAAGSADRAVMEHPIFSMLRQAMPSAIQVFLSDEEAMAERNLIGAVDFNLFSAGVAIKEGENVIFKSGSIASNYEDFIAMLMPAQPSMAVASKSEVLDIGAAMARIDELNAEIAKLKAAIDAAYVEIRELEAKKAVTQYPDEARKPDELIAQKYEAVKAMEEKLRDLQAELSKLKMIAGDTGSGTARSTGSEPIPGTAPAAQ